jgi:plasmid replication initiation protein
MDPFVPTDLYAPIVSGLRAASEKRAAREGQSKKHVSIEPAVFWICQIPNLSFKDDMASMEAAIFTLETKKDLQVGRWKSKDGKRSMVVTPSFYGRATMFDKDLLIYLISNSVALVNRGEIPSRTIRFTAHHFLKSIGKVPNSNHHRRMRPMMNRLLGTMIETDIATGGRIITEAFGLIDSWRMVSDERKDSADRLVIEVTLSEWTYRAVLAKEVLTINPAYFNLRKALERRLYEIARKHVGKQTSWDIGLETLRSKCGSTIQRLRQFRAEVSKIAVADTLPDYRVDVISDTKVRFITRDTSRILKNLAKATL